MLTRFSPAVNRAANDEPALIEPISPQQAAALPAGEADAGAPAKTREKNQRRTAGNRRCFDLQPPCGAGLCSLPGLTRQINHLAKRIDAPVKPAHDGCALQHLCRSARSSPETNEKTALRRHLCPVDGLS